jgi:mannose-6-phosphate isomerase-like protein (cupin superfamily)
MSMRFVAGFVVIVALCSSVLLSQEKPHAKVVKLEGAGKHDTVLLGGPPETVTIRSGLVILQPGQTVGKHSTDTREEMLVVLEGKGAMMFNGGSRLEVDPDHILYCPPQTEHDVTNTGSGVLRYVYIVASAKE